MSDLKRNDKPETKQDTVVLRQSLEALRDDVRLRIHLGGMELRDAFEKIEHEVNHLTSRATPVATRALNDVAVRLRRIAHALDGKQ